MGLEESPMNSLDGQKDEQLDPRTNEISLEEK